MIFMSKIKTITANRTNLIEHGNRFNVFRLNQKVSFKTFFFGASNSELYCEERFGF